MFAFELRLHICDVEKEGLVSANHLKGFIPTGVILALGPHMIFAEDTSLCSSHEWFLMSQGSA